MLRLDKTGKLREQFCPDITEWRRDTNLDEIFMSMFHKLQGDLRRIRDTPIEEGTKTEKGASLFDIARRVGRPCKEAVAAAAAARLVGRRWREYKQKAAKAQRDAEAIKEARASRMKLGMFTSRNNAIVGVKDAAMVEVSMMPSRAHACHCSPSLTALP